MFLRQTQPKGFNLPYHCIPVLEFVTLVRTHNFKLSLRNTLTVNPTQVSGRVGRQLTAQFAFVCQLVAVSRRARNTMSGKNTHEHHARTNALQCGMRLTMRC
jgi:hypothetical protein